MAKIKLTILNRSDNTIKFLLANGVSPLLTDDIEKFEIEVDITADDQITDSQPSKRGEVNALKSQLSK